MTFLSAITHAGKLEYALWASYLMAGGATLAGLSFIAGVFYTYFRSRWRDASRTAAFRAHIIAVGRERKYEQPLR